MLEQIGTIDGKPVLLVNFNEAEPWLSTVRVNGFETYLASFQKFNPYAEVVLTDSRFIEDGSDNNVE